MSYCRVGKDSDVYVYCGLKFEVIFAEGVQKTVDLMEKTGFISKSFETEKETLEYLKSAKDAGFKIPEYAIKRLEMECNEKEKDKK